MRFHTWGRSIVRRFEAIYFHFSIYRKLDPPTRRAWDKLGPGKVLVDVGANVGQITAAARRKGATVHSIEPNPWARAVLEERFHADSEVTLHAFAAATREGQATLFLHEQHLENPERFSSGSSMVPSKPNVSDLGQTVATRDFAVFLNSLSAVDFLKIDIEGYEVSLIPYLVSEVRWEKIAFVAIETHNGEKWSDLETATERMKRDVADAELTAKFSWSWP